MFLAAIVSVTLAVTPLTIPASAGSLKDPPADHRHNAASKFPTADDPFDFPVRVQAPEDDDDPREFWNRIEQESSPNGVPPRRRVRVPPPGRHPYVFVRCYSQRFYIPEPILRKHQLIHGENIAPELARQIAVELGARYTEDELELLRQLDKKENCQ